MFFLIWITYQDTVHIFIPGVNGVIQLHSRGAQWIFYWPRFLGWIDLFLLFCALHRWVWDIWLRQFTWRTACIHLFSLTTDDQNQTINTTIYLAHMWCHLFYIALAIIYISANPNALSNIFINPFLLQSLLCYISKQVVLWTSTEINTLLLSLTAILLCYLCPPPGNIQLLTVFLDLLLSCFLLLWLYNGPHPFVLFITCF